MANYQPGTPASDQVPTSGPWQSDPVIREFIAWYRTQPQAPRGSAAAADQARQARLLAYHRYIDQNRRRLGIPDNYWPDARTNGQTLYDPNQNVWRDILLTGGAMAAGGYFLGGLLEPAAAALPGAPNATPGLLPNTTPVPYDAVNLLPPAAPAAAAVPGATAPGLLDRLLDHATDPENLVRAGAAAIPAFVGRGGGGDNPFGSEETQQQLADTVNRLLAMQEGRVQQSQPIFDALVSQAHNMTPTAYRSANGPTVSNPPAGPYTYQAPRFGR